MKPKIWLSSPHMGGTEMSYIRDAFDTNWIAPVGPNVDGFEDSLRKFLNPDISVAALSSGTAAIHLALIILGVGAGDEVICQSMTFAASANPIVYQGARPIFIDSEEDTWNMSPEFLELAIRDRLLHGKKPKAIILVHLYGMPAQINKIQKIAKQYDIPLVEDAAEALGASFDGQMLGTFGDLGIFSFNGNKIITTSGGGALVSFNNKYISKAKFLSTQALDPAPHYQHSSIGFNYRMSNVCAGIGRGQMEILSKRIEQRRANFNYYKKELSAINSISVLEEPGEEYYSNRWLTTILVEDETFDRETIRQTLQRDNIDSRPLWKPMHLQPVFDAAPFYGDGTSNRLFENGLCLPSGSDLTEVELDRVITGIYKAAQCETLTTTV